jgi:phosphotransferase system  glucose/maltose/N-acetylglucosamine-specific IIC component
MLLDSFLLYPPKNTTYLGWVILVSAKPLNAEIFYAFYEIQSSDLRLCVPGKMFLNFVCFVFNLIATAWRSN